MGACGKILNVIACILFGVSLLCVLVSFDPKKAGGFVSVEFAEKQQNGGKDCFELGCGGYRNDAAWKAPYNSNKQVGWQSSGNGITKDGIDVGKRFFYHPIYISLRELKIPTCAGADVDGTCAGGVHDTESACTGASKVWTANEKCKAVCTQASCNKLKCEQTDSYAGTKKAAKCVYTDKWEKCEKPVNEDNAKKPRAKDCVHLLTDYLDRREKYLGWYESYAIAGPSSVSNSKVNLRLEYMTSLTTAASICFCTAIACHLIAFALGGFIFNWKVGCVNSLHFATIALVLYIASIAIFAGNFTTPGLFRDFQPSTGMGNCRSLVGATDVNCTKAVTDGGKTKPQTVKKLCEAAMLAADGILGSKKGDKCVFSEYASIAGTWSGYKGKKKIAPGGALMVVGILFMFAAIALAGYQWKRDQDAKAGPAPNVRLVEVRQG